MVHILAEVNFILHLYEISKLNTMHLAVWVCFGWDLKNWDPVYCVWVLKISLSRYMLLVSCLIPSTLWDVCISSVLCVHSCKMFWGPAKRKVPHVTVSVVHIHCTDRNGVLHHLLLLFVAFMIITALISLKK